jgi:hypothetical protein
LNDMDASASITAGTSIKVSISHSFTAGRFPVYDRRWVDPGTCKRAEADPMYQIPDIFARAGE